MRCFALLLIGGLCVPLWAQDPIPDTTDVWRYFPLEVGNVWEYSVFVHSPPMPPEFGFDRWTVIGDSAVEHLTYQEILVEEYDVGGNPSGSHTRLFRLDTLTAEILVPEFGGGERAIMGTACGLDAPFPPEGVQVECQTGSWVTGEGYEREVILIDDHIPVVLVTAVKSFYEYPVGNYRFGADIGLVRNEGCEGGCWDYQLVYTSVSGTEYGTPFPVAVELDAPTVTGFGFLAVYPNPSMDRFSISLSSDNQEVVTVEVFDLLGRRVYSDEHIVGAGERTLHVDGSDWPRGFYAIRVTTAEGKTATARITRQ